MPLSSYREYPPSARLAPYIECYWSRADSPFCAEQYQVLPDGCADILFTTRHSEPSALNIVGLMTKPLAVEPSADLSYFGVRFHPGMAAAFLPEAAELIDSVAPLAQIRGSLARELTERLAAASADPQRIEIFERVLRPLEAPNAARRALWRFRATLDQQALSNRHFRRACTAQTGVSPKVLQRILRFRHAADRIRGLAARAAQPGWAQFAAACGYYDQAHFIHEFQQFASLTPGRFLQSLRPVPALQSEHHEPIANQA